MLQLSPRCVSFSTGLPLAIELAAARIKLFTPEQLQLRLDNQLRILTSGPGDAPQRHQTMRATIDWSFQLLTPVERAVFRNLAVFSGGATFDAIAQVAAPDHDATEPLTALVNHSLVRQREDEHGDVRFDVLRVIREYTLGLGREPGESGSPLPPRGGATTSRSLRQRLASTARFETSAKTWDWRSTGCSTQVHPVIVKRPNSG